MSQRRFLLSSVHCQLFDKKVPEGHSLRTPRPRALQGPERTGGVAPPAAVEATLAGDCTYQWFHRQSFQLRPSFNGQVTLLSFNPYPYINTTIHELYIESETSSTTSKSRPHTTSRRPVHYYYYFFIYYRIIFAHSIAMHAVLSKLLQYRVHNDLEVRDFDAAIEGAQRRPSASFVSNPQLMAATAAHHWQLRHHHTGDTSGYNSDRQAGREDAEKCKNVRLRPHVLGSARGRGPLLP